MSSSSSSSSLSDLLVLFQPTEMSHEEYQSLLQQIRNDWTILECQDELMEAARYNDIDVVRAILQVHHAHIPSIQPPVEDKERRRGGNTPLHMAAANGHIEVMELLLATGLTDPSVTNAAGNTALHWASQNGQDAAVQLLLKHDAKADVLQRNAFGRSALTEGFTSQNTAVVNSLLEHDSATEEKLLMNATPASGQGGEEGEVEEKGEEDGGVTHDFLFLDTPLRVRELPMSRGHEGESILGQANPSDDTTGLGIWAASLVMAQWMAHLCKNEDRFRPKKSSSTTTTTILELGAGCGVPALTIAKMMAKLATSFKVYATDFNPQTVKNLQYNMELNECGCHQHSISASEDDDATSSSMNDDDCKATIATNSSMDIDCLEATPATKNATTVAMIMNWQDPTTWPSEPMDFVIGSDLIYQSDMVPLLVQTISRLLKKQTGTFLYCAPETQGRQGHDEFMLLMSEHFTCTMEQSAPASYLTNPLAGQDDDLCYLHFHELQSSSFKLYEFSWKK